MAGKGSNKKGGKKKAAKNSQPVVTGNKKGSKSKAKNKK
jgi:hypothetical protein